MLTIPLVTLLGLAGHPGDAHGLGALDPALARQMAASAARNPRSTWCVTVTDQQGHAIGHGCARPARTRRKPSRASPARTRDGPPLTFTPADDHGPPPDGGYGTWHLTTGGRDYTVTLIPIPVHDCDHRYETAGYQPGRLLRHLVEVRDGQCTQPTCVRAARRCDFEHAVPYEAGGRTCGCNGGCRCRRDHKVKQSPGWKVTQPRPGKCGSLRYRAPRPPAAPGLRARPGVSNNEDPGDEARPEPCGVSRADGLYPVITEVGGITMDDTVGPPGNDHGAAR